MMIINGYTGLPIYEWNIMEKKTKYQEFCVFFMEEEEKEVSWFVLEHSILPITRLYYGSQ